MAGRTDGDDAAVMRARADGLRDARENLGKWIGILKADFPEPPPEGVVRRFPEYLADRGLRAADRG
jgi:hypothetical protein